VIFHPQLFQGGVATLECTVEEFHKFIGPKVRNDIQYLTKKRKRSLGYRCENCGKKRELEAAHIGASRKQIIERVLRKHRSVGSAGRISVDLAEVRNEISTAHVPIEKHVRMLCSDCHRKLDARVSWS
jgi:predicted RNA-binding Zn-ribbon protein involved in translation (DUF1610 family)